MHSRTYFTAPIPLLLYVALAALASTTGGTPVVDATRTFITFFIYHLCYGAGTLIGMANLATGRPRMHLGVPLRE